MYLFIFIPKSLSRKRKRVTNTLPAAHRATSPSSEHRAALTCRPSRPSISPSDDRGSWQRPLRSVEGAGQVTHTHGPTPRARGIRGGKPGDHIKTRGVPNSAVRRTGHSAVGTQASSTAAARAIPSPRYASLPRRRFLLLLLHPRPSRSGARARPRW